MVRGKLTVVANTSKNVKRMVATTLTGRNCPIVVTYLSPRGTTSLYGQVRRRANGARVRIQEVSLTSLSSMGGFANRLLGRKHPIDHLVGGTNVLAAPMHGARSKLRAVMDIGCITPCVLAHRLLPLVRPKYHVMGAISYACTVNQVRPSFFRGKEGKHFFHVPICKGAGLTLLLFARRFTRQLRSGSVAVGTSSPKVIDAGVVAVRT